MSPWKCKNVECEEENINNLVNDRETGDVICTACGFVQDIGIEDVISLARHGAGVTFDRSVVPGHNFKDTYIRFVHFMERFAAHEREDPIVPEVDMDIIRANHQKLMERSYFYRERVRQGIIDKKDIQQLLRFIDGTYKKKKTWRSVSKLAKEKLEIKKKKPSPKVFSRAYLERWNSIILDLTGVEFELYHPQVFPKMVGIMEKFSDLWDAWQDPKGKFDPEKKSWRYKKRKHFPNINFILQKVHSVLNVPQHYNKHFPLPTTEGSIKNLKMYWKDMCNELVKRKQLDPSWLSPEDLPEKYTQLTLDEYVARSDTTKDMEAQVRCGLG